MAYAESCFSLRAPVCGWCMVCHFKFESWVGCGHGLVCRQFVGQLLVVVAQQAADSVTVNGPGGLVFSGGAMPTLRAPVTAFTETAVDKNHPDR